MDGGGVDDDSVDGDCSMIDDGKDGKTHPLWEMFGLDPSKRAYDWYSELSVRISEHTYQSTKRASYKDGRG